MMNSGLLLQKLEQLLWWEIQFCRRTSNKVVDGLSHLVPGRPLQGHRIQPQIRCRYTILRCSPSRLLLIKLNKHTAHLVHAAPPELLPRLPGAAAWTTPSSNHASTGTTVTLPYPLSQLELFYWAGLLLLCFVCFECSMYFFASCWFFCALGHLYVGLFCLCTRLFGVSLTNFRSMIHSHVQ